MSKLKSLNKFTVTNIKCYGMVIIAFAILYPMLQADMISNKISGLLIPICAYVVMAISLNLTVGFLGELSLGHAGFMSVGAFSGVITVACMQDGMPAPVKLLIAIIIGGIMAGILGLIIGIPVIRLKGDYLAIVTLAFGEIIKNIINCVYVGLDGSGLHFSMKSAEALGMDAGKMILNGPQGAVSISKIST
ncbi:MAG: branched-chain amino acid ABC transporter permease, partial [Eubacteriales bacterium]|nr:branched-chain amino acid ABC transporter permease [Eubacteriales bacterium]